MTGKASKELKANSPEEITAVREQNETAAVVTFPYKVAKIVCRPTSLSMTKIGWRERCGLECLSTAPHFPKLNEIPSLLG